MLRIFHSFKFNIFHKIILFLLKFSQTNKPNVCIFIETCLLKREILLLKKESLAKVNHSALFRHAHLYSTSNYLWGIKIQHS